MSPLVLLHGFTGTPGAFEPMLRQLGRPAMTPALLGHGPGPDADDWEGELERLGALLDRQPPVHLVGYSLGARVALGLALAFPAKVARLSLIGVNPGLDPAHRPARQAWEEDLARRLETRGIDDFIDYWEALPLWESQRHLPEPVRLRQRAARRSHRAEGLARSLRRCGLGQMPDLRPGLRSLDLPVDLVVGALDTRFLALARTIVRALPHATLHPVEGVGHNVVLEAPGPLARLLAADPQRA